MFTHLYTYIGDCTMMKIGKIRTKQQSNTITLLLLRDVGVAQWTSADTRTLKEIAGEIDRGDNWRLRGLLHQLREEKRRVEAAVHRDTAPVDISG